MELLHPEGEAEEVHHLLAGAVGEEEQQHWVGRVEEEQASRVRVLALVLEVEVEEQEEP